jgi:hypothetical protein
MPESPFVENSGDSRAGGVFSVKKDGWRHFFQITFCPAACFIFADLNL